MQSTYLHNAFDSGVYNALIPVESADAVVRADSRIDAFLQAAAGVFADHRMESRFGVALLHRHNRCEQDEHMVEYTETVGGVNALVTRPTTVDPAAEDAVPSVWAMAGRTFVPLEYTTDVGAVELFRAGDVPAAFLHDFAALIESSPIGHLMGLAIVKRDYYRTGGSGDVALEYSNLLPQNSVVLMSDRAAAGDRSIQTAWIVDKVDPRGTKVCTKVCHSSTAEGHTGQVVHEPLAE